MTHVYYNSIKSLKNVKNFAQNPNNYRNLMGENLIIIIKKSNRK